MPRFYSRTTLVAVTTSMRSVVFVMVVLWYAAPSTAQAPLGITPRVNVEVGHSTYVLVQHSAKAIGLIGATGFDFEIRGGQKWAMLIGATVGRRRYVEEYELGHVAYDLDHRSTDIGVRLIGLSQLCPGRNGSWDMAYGFCATVRHRSSVNVRNSMGESGVFNSFEPGALGLRFGLLWNQKVGPREALCIGPFVSLFVTGAREPLSPSWQTSRSLEVGQSRIVTGISASWRIVTLPWRFERVEESN